MSVLNSHLGQTLQLVRECQTNNTRLLLNGCNLSIADLHRVSQGQIAEVNLAEECYETLLKNANYLESKVQQGYVIYGVNTGYGGSADVRCDDIAEVQCSLIRHLNAGFGDKLPHGLIRCVMVVRANSLARGYSGVRPCVVDSLLALYNNDIIPDVPKRGSISASGDLMPTSYIAACLMGRSDLKTTYKGQSYTAANALKASSIQPVIFRAKEALAVVNASSFASSLAACILFDANLAVLFTQLATALSHEALEGHIETFHPTIHQCLPHIGQQEVAANIKALLTDSLFLLQDLDIRLKDTSGSLKQDRYALRSSPQWLGPVIETLVSSNRSIIIEINSANDNPIIDHRQDEILHGGNFQGSFITVAMDHCRQGLQMCGKLLFGQMQELVNGQMNKCLPPNLAGSDFHSDFGFKGADTAMASYMSELDYLTNCMTNHVLSAELHNQSVNSLALVSARYTEQAMDILYMMLTNIMVAQLQAIDLRWLQLKFEAVLEEIYLKHHVKVSKSVRASIPWYQLLFTPRAAILEMLEEATTNGVNIDNFISDVIKEAKKYIDLVHKNQHVEHVCSSLGTGTRIFYRYVRCDLAVSFYHGEDTIDNRLERLYTMLKSHKRLDLLLQVFRQCES